MGCLRLGKSYIDLRTLKVEECEIFGLHQETFWVLCERLEGLNICRGKLGLPGGEVLSKKKLSGSIKAAITSASADDHIQIKISKRFPRMMDLKISAMREARSEDFL
jgi:hypothetical protein